MSAEKTLKSLGHNLRKARKQLDLRQVDVAERSSITYRHYQDIETGKINISVETLCKLARILRTTPSDLLDEC